MKRAPDSLTEAQKAAEQIAELLMTGAYKNMSPEQRIAIHTGLCKSLGLNPLSKPFDYIEINNKMVIYANKSCTEQLRKIHGVSVVEHNQVIEDNLVIVTVKVQDRMGRTDFATGCVPVPTGAADRANAYMKASTKAKRRATLSICGLGFVDESELDTVTITGGFTPEGRVYQLPEKIEPCSACGHALPYADCAEGTCPQKSKLNEAQREVVERKTQEAKAKKVETVVLSVENSSLICKKLPNGSYEVTGPKPVLRQVYGVLSMWLIEGSQHTDTPKFGIPADVLTTLKAECAAKKIPIEER